mmetsp:Transcript_11323/g.15801  ORF Transcript_11323/g.15801 Transcript_11323/m.15801 type:complete len:112 (-) Transcript_11323:107-442(-)
MDWHHHHSCPHPRETNGTNLARKGMGSCQSEIGTRITLLSISRLKHFISNLSVAKTRDDILMVKVFCNAWNAFYACSSQLNETPVVIRDEIVPFACTVCWTFHFMLLPRRQ